MNPLAPRPLGRTGLHVSGIGFGALEIGRDWAPDVNPGDTGRHPDAAEAERTLLGLADAGVNLVDTAPAYWHSEDFIGRAFSANPGLRDRFVLATKVGEHCHPDTGSRHDYSAEATRAFIDDSLVKLRTDRIDLIQIHSASMDTLERGECLAAMIEARDAGKVRHVGMTGHVAECVRAVELGGYESVQVPLNLLNPAAEDTLLPLALERGVGVLLMRPLAGGKLTPKVAALEDETLRAAVLGFVEAAGDGATPDDLPGLAMAWLLTVPGVSSLLVGTRKPGTVTANIAAAARTQMPPDRRARLRAWSDGLTTRGW